MPSQRFRILKWLGVTSGSRLYRAEHLHDQQSVILKFPRTKNIGELEAARFRRERELLRSLNVAGVTKPIEDKTEPSSAMIVLQNCPGELLETVLRRQQLDVAVCLRFARSLARSLDGLHLAQVTHKDLRPANILIDLETGASCIVDLSSAASIDQDTVALGDYQEEWAYLAPEQAGRGRQQADYLADFYSLGVILYRMLTGCLPFEARDALEWAQRLSGRPPQSPAEIVPQVPRVVSDIVMKLLARLPADRYQSAVGLQFDLERCLEQWEGSGPVELFTLGTHDTSDRKRSEELQRWLATMVEASSDAIIGNTLDGNIVIWNLGAERMYGYTATEVVGRSIAILMPAYRVDETAVLLDKIRRGERIQNFETERMCKDGRLIDVSLTISPINDVSGGIIGVSTIARDISDRKRAERALRESEERYRIVAETATDAIVTIDETGIITYANSAAEKIFGYRLHEMLGKDLSVLMPERVRRVYDRAMDRYFRYGKRNIPWEGVEISGLHKEGYEIPLEVSFGEFRQHGKHIFTGIMRDITDRRRAQESQRLLATMVESSSDAIIGATLDGVVLSWNRGAERMYGFTAEEMIGNSKSMLVPPELAQEYLEIYERVRQGERVENQETVRLRKDGKRIYVSQTISPIEDASGTIIGVSGIVRDITDRKRAEEELREREERIRRLVNSNIIGIIFWNLSTGVVDANAAFLNMLGYNQTDLQSGTINWSELTPPEYLSADARAADELRKSGSIAPYEKELIRRDGSRVPVLVGAVLLEGSQEKGIAFVLDVSERKRAEERIRHMAQHDALTGLPNRVLFQDRLMLAITQARRAQKLVAVLFIDLDHFKDINDSLGHQVGDRLLRMMARRVQQCLREGDSVARLGGDEFVISLPGLENPEAASVIAGKVLEALRRPFLVDEHELHVSTSIGISIYPTDGQDVEALMRAADTAMYHAKEQGRDNSQFFTPRLNEAARRRLTIANRLHQALQRGDFTLHYQPQVDLDRGRIFSAEALVRCSHPELEQASCSEIIRVAEETGLIATLGERVLRQATTQLKRWHDSGYRDLRIAVNISPYQFRRPGFPELVAGILQEVGLPATALEIELTETMLMMQSEENMTTLERLAVMGMRLAVDDFGTGYSSLAYLQRFPINSLKIDQSFVSGIGRDPNDTAIVRAIIAMAGSLHLQVVAEGVETTEQAAFLKEHGCKAGQGFYFSHAVAAEVFTELLSTEYKKASGTSRVFPILT